MANTIKIKRSTTTATPTSLNEGELAYSESSNNLFIGTSGSNLEKICGKTDVDKLSGIESGATADQTNAEIKTAYEANSDTNEFSDAEQTKLSGIATGAEVNVQSDFSAGSGDAQILNVPDPTITLTGSVTGAGTLTNLGNVSIATTATADPTITLGGDLSGSVTLTNLGNGTLSASITHDASGVTSSKISNWDNAYSWYSTMTTADGDSIIDTVNEIVSAFENHAEGLNLITELDAKLTASSTIDGGTF